MDKNQHGILKLSLQKRWVCGQSPEQRLWGPRFGSRLPVGLYATHLEKGFLISMLCHSAEWRNPLRAVHKVQLPMQQTGSSGTLRNQLRREQLRQPQCKYRKKGVLLDPMALSKPGPGFGFQDVSVLRIPIWQLHPAAKHNNGTSKEQPKSEG